MYTNIKIKRKMKNKGKKYTENNRKYRMEKQNNIQKIDIDKKIGKKYI